MLNGIHAGTQRRCDAVVADSVRRHFFPWDRPLLPQAVEFLTKDWSGNALLDLSRWLVVVPTRQAGRRLREALAAHAHERKQAVFPPLRTNTAHILRVCPGQTSTEIPGTISCS